MNHRIILAMSLLCCLGAASATEPDFFDELARIDQALKTNPSNVLRQSLESCLTQRSYALTLYKMGMETRARRALAYCVDALMIPAHDAEVQAKVEAVAREELEALAQAEYEQAMALTGDVANGLEIYRQCAACHEPEGWGRTTGSVPQIAGQHRKVVIQQLADFRAGLRNSVIMAPYATVEIIGGVQELADVAAYIDTLEMSVANGKGDGESLSLGGELYAEFCTACHGASGEGDNDEGIPRLQAQHYKYLLRQFEWMLERKRRDTHPEMLQQMQKLDEQEIAAVLDYVSRFEPPAEFQAPPGWKNPDFQ